MVTEAPLEARMGWVPGSNMAKVYIHLGGGDQDAAILKVPGIGVRQGEVEKVDLPKGFLFIRGRIPRDA